jgi:hypothetical protein
MSTPAFFHIPSGTVRFWVLIDGLAVGASIGKETLHYRYKPDASDDDPLATYTANAAEIELAVRRRVAGGSPEPVMLRDPDVRRRAEGALPHGPHHAAPAPSRHHAAPEPGMTDQEDIASIRSRLHQAESERIGWRMAGQQEKYIEACSRVKAIEVQLDERLSQSRASSTAPPIAK